MNRILSWFLVSLLLALSGPVQALSMASARGFEKSLYGRSAPTQHKYAYCAGDPINCADPSGLQPPGSGGTWWDQSIINTQGSEHRASPGHILTGAENEAGFWGELILWVVGEGAAKGGAQALGAYREAQALKSYAKGWKAVEGFTAEANLARHIAKHAQKMGISPVKYAKAAEAYLERNACHAYELKERPGVWKIVREGKNMMYEVVDGVKQITTWNIQGG